MKSLLVLIAFCVCFTQSRAQIIYHDLNPDIIFPSIHTSPNFSYDLDIDANGTMDYKVSQRIYSGYNSFEIGGYANNKVCANVISSNYVDTLNYGNQISVNSNLSVYGLWFDLVPNNIGPWYNVTNKFVGICFNTPSGVKYGWIRLLNMISIADYAYNDSSTQPILAGEGLPNKATGIQLFDVSDFGDGTDLRVKFYKVFEEFKTAGYKVIVVPSSRLATFSIDSAKQVLNTNSLLIPVMNKNIDTLFSSIAKDVYGNPIVSLKHYNGFVLTLPDLVTTFDTLMSAVSNEIVLQAANLPAQVTSITSTKIPGSSYNLDLSFNPPASETGILNYRLFFIKENDSTRFDIDTANLVSSLNYITIPKTGAPQQLNFQSNLVNTYNGDFLRPFIKYRAVLMSVTDTLNTNTSVLSNASNSFTVYTQVQSVDEIIMSDVGDNHMITDINAFFKKVSDESNILGYRGLIVPETSLSAFNLDSANSTSNYAFYPKNGQNHSAQFLSMMNDIHGNAILESEKYNFFVLTISDHHFADINALSAPKYFGYNTPNYFYAGFKDTSKVIYRDIKDTSFYGQAYVQPHSYSIDFDHNGSNDLTFSAHVHLNPLMLEDYATPSPNLQMNFSTPVSNYIMAHDSADMLFDDLNWRSSGGTLRMNSNGLWDYNDVKFVAVRLLGQDTTYGWVKLSVKYNGTLGYTIYSYGMQKGKSQVGIKEENNTMNISLYPNPASEFSIIQSHDFKNARYKIEVLNMNGQIIISDRIISNHYKINTSEMTKGVYALRIIKDDGNTKVMKLIVQ